MGVNVLWRLLLGFFVLKKRVSFFLFSCLDGLFELLSASCLWKIARFKRQRAAESKLLDLKEQKERRGRSTKAAALSTPVETGEDDVSDDDGEEEREVSKHPYLCSVYEHDHCCEFLLPYIFCFILCCNFYHVDCTFMPSHPYCSCSCTWHILVFADSAFMDLHLHRHLSLLFGFVCENNLRSTFDSNILNRMCWKIHDVTFHILYLISLRNHDLPFRYHLIC